MKKLPKAMFVFSFVFSTCLFSTHVFSSSKDAHDKYANQETNYIKKQANNKKQSKPTLYQGKVSDRCVSNRFPKNAVMKKSGKQYIAKCSKGRVTIIQNKKVQRPWKKGDPVLSSKPKQKGPKKEIRNVDLSDEMPEDLPAG